MRKLLTAFVIVLTLFCSTVSSFAAQDPNVVLVNPASYSIVYSNNLLISVKITQPKNIRVNFYQEMQTVNGTQTAVTIGSQATFASTVSGGSYSDVAVTSAAFYASTNNLSFFTKQYTNLKPGLYKVKIDTMDSSYKEVLYSTISYVAVKEKTESADEANLEAPQSGTMQFLQNILKTIFD